MENARIETQNIVNNTNKPFPDWEKDYTTDLPTKFRPLPLIEELTPTTRILNTTEILTGTMNYKTNSSSNFITTFQVKTTIMKQTNP